MAINEIIVSKFCAARYTEMTTQLRTAKAHADSAKQELSDYKDKAARILQVCIYHAVYLQ